MRAAYLGGGPFGGNIVVMGASIDWGGHYDAADHNVRDWPTIVVGQCPDVAERMLFAPCTRVNVAVSGAMTYQVGEIPYRADQSRTIVVFGPIWANNIGSNESADDCYAYLVSQVSAVRALGVAKIIIATGYLLAGESGPQQAEFTALNAMIVSGKGGYPGAQIVRLDTNPPIDVANSADFPDGGHPSCPGSSVSPGPGCTIMARQYAPAINALL